jgi:hypothetical protein
MNAKLHSALTIARSVLAFLTAIILFTSADRAPAQTGWGNALWFDGTNDYVVADAVPLANASFTIEAWARRDTTGTMDMIVTQDDSGGTSYRSLMFGFHWFGFVLDFIGDGVSSTNVDNTWHHWAGTFDASNRLRCLYRDGVLLATNVAAQNYQGSGQIFIGREPFDDPAYFAGMIDEVRIWSIARSQAEIQANMSHPLTGSESNLIAYWKFDETAGTTTCDSTTNGHNGTLFNGPQWTPSTIPNPPMFGCCGVAAPGQFRLQAAGLAGVTYTLQTSIDLANWADHTNLVADPAGSIECVEEIESFAPACFYRLK